MRRLNVRSGAGAVWLVSRARADPAPPRSVSRSISVGTGGELSGMDVLDRYVTPLGDLREVVANFGDEQFKVD
jgi:hypothetical protein